MLTISEENYLKAIHKISQNKGNPVSTSDLAAQLSTSAASVTDMMKRLHEKQMVTYNRYQGVSLTPSGVRHATLLVRRHRLWECFLVDKLQYRWDEVHDLAEQLEHIRSEDLVDRLEQFLDFPRYDPHGDPIPDRSGKWTWRAQFPLSTLEPGEKGQVVGVALHDHQFLQFLGDMQIEIGTNLEVLEVFDFDSSMRVQFENSNSTLLSPVVTKNVHVKKI